MFRIKTDIRQYKCESPDKVEKLIRNWVIRPTDLIFSTDNADWTPIGEHPVFTPLFELLNEQLRNEPDTLVTRNPLAPPSAPDGVESNRADNDEITTMTRRTRVFLTSDEPEKTPEKTTLQTTEPLRKIGRHDLPEELFATAELHGPISRNDVPPLIDELAELSEPEQDFIEDDEHTKVVEFEPEPEPEPEPENNTPEPENSTPEPDNSTPEPQETEKTEDLTQTTESTAFARTATWTSPNTPIPEENDDDLILAQDLSTTTELVIPNTDSTQESQEESPETTPESTDSTQETPETTPEPQEATTETTETTPETTSDTDETIERTAPIIDKPTKTEEPQNTETQIPEGYTVELPPIAPSQDDIHYGLALSTASEQEKERTFHTPTPQPLTTVTQQTFDLSIRPRPTPKKATPRQITADYPATESPDTPKPNKKAAMIFMAAILLIVTVIIIAKIAT